MATDNKPQGPISASLHHYLIELAAQMQTLSADRFEVANAALKGALAEVERVSELEKHVVVTD